MPRSAAEARRLRRGQKPARRSVSGARKVLFVLGTIGMVVGLVSFLSVFVSGALMFAEGPDSFGGGFGTLPLRGVGGFLLILFGGMLRGLGARGAAGSGLVLDPERAREDLEPWARMGGGMVKDALDEAGVDLSARRGGDSELPFDEKLRRLHALHADGLLTDEEFAQEKRELLDSN